MINLVTGKTGSGKTFYNINEMLKYIDGDRKIYTNILLNLEHENYIYFDEKNIKEFFEYINDTFANVENLEEKKEQLRSGVYANAIFFIDEAHLVGFKKINESINNWITLHRHFNQDIYIITQVPTNLHRDYLPQFHYHIDMIASNKKIPGTIGYRKFDGYKGERLKTKFFKPDTLIFEMYNTGKAESETHPYIYQLGVLLIAMVIGIAFIVNQFMSVDKIINPSLNESVIQGQSLASSSVTENNQTEDINTTVVTTVIYCGNPELKGSVCDYPKSLTPARKFYLYHLKQLSVIERDIVYRLGNDYMERIVIRS
jgi:zona occludens toxin (predicted ATPase)